MNVWAGTITSSPGCMPTERRARCSADEPLFKPLTYFVPQYLANCLSKISTNSPPEKAVFSKTALSAESISLRRVTYCRLRSKNGIRDDNIFKIGQKCQDLWGHADRPKVPV